MLLKTPLISIPLFPIRFDTHLSSAGPWDPPSPASPRVSSSLTFSCTLDLFQQPALTPAPSIS